MHYRLILLLLALVPHATLHASGIRGHIRAEDGLALGFATIFVRQTGTGAVSNEGGFYEIKLQPGTYDVVYQYLEYETHMRTAELTSDYATIDITMKLQITAQSSMTVEA